MTRPGRVAKRIVKSLTRRLTWPCAVLMYHRVADVAIDPWALCVKPDHFAEQLEVLSRTCHVVPLGKLDETLDAKRNLQPVMAITFDDGYADNLLTAKPLLEEAGLPATVFVTTGPLDSGREFWWDELAQLLLHNEPLPELVTLPIAGRQCTWHLDNRDEAYMAVWDTLQALPHAQQVAGLDALRERLGIATIVREDYRTLSSQDVVTLADGGLVHIGAHTVTHPMLTRCESDYQLREMTASKAALEALVNKPVNRFAYPFGDYDGAVARVAGTAGFSIACTTEERRVSRRSDPLRIPRFAVGDWDGERFTHWLRSL